MKPSLPPRLTLIESAQAAPLDPRAIRSMSMRARITEALKATPSAARAYLEGYSYEDYIQISSWTLQELGPILEREEVLDEAYEVFEGLAWRHLNRGKSQYYHLAKQALLACKRIAYALDDTDRYRESLAVVWERHGNKRVIQTLRG